MWWGEFIAVLDLGSSSLGKRDFFYFQVCVHVCFDSCIFFPLVCMCVPACFTNHSDKTVTLIFISWSGRKRVLTNKPLFARSLPLLLYIWIYTIHCLGGEGTSIVPVVLPGSLNFLALSFSGKKEYIYYMTKVEGRTLGSRSSTWGCSWDFSLVLFTSPAIVVLVFVLMRSNLLCCTALGKFFCLWFLKLRNTVPLRPHFVRISSDAGAPTLHYTSSRLARRGSWTHQLCTHFLHSLPFLPLVHLKESKKTICMVGRQIRPPSFFGGLL